MTIRKVIIHSNVRYRVDFGKRSGKRRVEFFKTEVEAQAALKRAIKDAKEVGKRWAELPADQRLGVATILNEMRASGLTLSQVWETFKAQQMRPVDGVRRRSFHLAIPEFLSAKKLANRRPSYIVSLESYLSLFARGREHMNVDQIRSGDVEEWFAGRTESLTTKHSNMGRLAAFFAFCVRRGYRKDNPVDALEKISLESRPPKILSLRQCAKALISTRREQPEYLAWLVLALLCGMRPEEAMNTKRADIELKFQWGTIDQVGIVRVDSAATKVRNRRIIHLSTAQREWLKVALKLKPMLPISKSSKKRFLKFLRTKLGFKAWPQDILRHTSASYQLAHYQDAGKVAREFGNSAGILLRRYTELVERPLAAKFVEMKPSPLKRKHGKR